MFTQHKGLSPKTLKEKLTLLSTEERKEAPAGFFPCLTSCDSQDEVFFPVLLKSLLALGTTLEAISHAGNRHFIETRCEKVT